MDDITLPLSTTPAEMMKDRRRSSQSRIIETSPQPQNYNSITPSEPHSEQNATEETLQSDHDEGGESEEESQHEWFGKRMWVALRQWEQNNLELILENKQSVARDHLGILNLHVYELIIANERTYLAWLRTSLSFASIGVAVTQLFRLSTTIQPGNPPKGFAELRRLGRPLGATFIGIAVLVLVLGVHRFGSFLLLD
jgi:Domain of unknown function (DUF202)